MDHSEIDKGWFDLPLDIHTQIYAKKMVMGLSHSALLKHTINRHVQLKEWKQNETKKRMQIVVIS